jgi:hypothetical protein
LLELFELAGIDSMLAVNLGKEALDGRGTPSSQHRLDVFEEIKLDQTEPAS